MERTWNSTTATHHLFDPNNNNGVTVKDGRFGGVRGGGEWTELSVRGMSTGTHAGVVNGKHNFIFPTLLCVPACV